VIDLVNSGIGSYTPCFSLNTVEGERQKYERKEGIRERRDGGGEGGGRGRTVQFT
jgi:hypothetical protein